ncbi:octanoyltransferase LipM [Insulibacter thermoxylanivorax]|uniref:Octanoyltransferase LipM n=1 Tax=Insulibacter thermoxylanivorax TaxID=2749268 RepID=A0A916QGU5_9BACL|nr:biotin/lipoate A/B protein ligase family protein [Insulibacter thermoxylanivorax]GFR38763.1 octanoyltransferase LipM [Insulibacter thermoxylanivorax]
MQTWRFIKSGAMDPAWNMAIDEAIMNAVSEEKAPPTLRFYGWQPPTLSIGYFQKAADEIDLEKVEARGIGFVRRPTGGRAVLHDQELTYSMILSESYPDIPKSVTESYRILSNGLLHGFRRLGLQADMVNLADEAEKAKYASAGSAACFDSPSWYELVVEGRKVAGSAQMRQRGVILQHGAILLDMDVDLLFDLLYYPNERLRERLKKSFREKAVAINDIKRALGQPPVTLAETEAAFEQGIPEGLGIKLELGDLSDWEQAEAKRLVEEKYGNREWNLRR